MTNLPPGVAPHDTDPPEQAPLEGSLIATVTLNIAFRIHGLGRRDMNYQRSDEIYTVEQAEQLLREKIRKLMRLNTRFSLVDIVEIEVERFLPNGT